MKSRQYSMAFGSYRKATFVTVQPVRKSTFELSLVKGFVELAHIRISKKQGIELAEFILKISEVEE